MPKIEGMDHETLAQQAAERRLEECYNTDHEWVVDDADEFCGCITCIVREVLTAATPHLYAVLVDVLTEEGVDVPPRIVKMFTVTNP